MTEKAQNGAPTAKQARLIEALLQYPTTGAALEAVGVGETTLRRWRADPAFVQALEAARRDLFGAGLDQLLGYQSDALASLHALVTGADGEHVRVRAALGLEQALARRYELAQLADLEARVAALEARP